MLKISISKGNSNTTRYAELVVQMRSATTLVVSLVVPCGFDFILLDWPPMEPVFCKLLDADTRGSAYCRCVNSVRHTLRFCRQSKLVVT
jgi:hypothetical protein